MPDSPWRYDRPSRRYRDSRSGRFLAFADAVDLRDGFQQRRRSDVDALVKDLGAKKLTIQDWEVRVTNQLRSLYAAQYALGRGGLGMMTHEDYLAADQLDEAQRVYLRGFAQDIGAGTLSLAQIAARAHLYYASSTQAYEHGQASAWGVSLPAYPGDGSTPCKANCACKWRLVESGDEIHATWTLGSTEHCTGCTQRAAAWAPLVIARAADGRTARLYRAVA